MNKKIIIALILLLIGFGLYYTISPLFRNIEVNDELPENTVVETGMPSGFEKLSPEKQNEMLEEMGSINQVQPDNMQEEMPVTATPTALASAEVMGTTGHPASGTVRVVNTEQGQIIRYEDFFTINGPRLHVYLAKDLEAKEFIDLGPVRGTKGNINYEVPEGTDLSEYRYVMYWCVPFGVLFNYADLGA